MKKTNRPSADFEVDERLLPLAKAIRTKRKSLRLSLRAIAARAGIQFGHLSRFELAQARALSVRSLLDVLEGLDMTLGAVELSTPKRKPAHACTGAQS